MKKYLIILLAVAALILFTNSHANAERIGRHSRRSHKPTYYRSVVWPPSYREYGRSYHSYAWVPGHWERKSKHRRHVKTRRYEPSPEFLLFYSISKIIQNCR